MNKIHVINVQYNKYMDIVTVIVSIQHQLNYLQLKSKKRNVK